MKRKTFLRQLSYVLFAVAMFFGTLIAITGCEDPTPPCELNNYGSVTVKNETGYTIWTDVTWGSIVENYEKRLYDNGSTKYSNVPAGRIEIWIRFDDNIDWEFNDEYLSACEDMTYRWYLSSYKSNDKGLRLDIINEYGDVLKTVTEFSHKEK